MTECGINFELSTNDPDKAVQLIRGYHELSGLHCDDLESIRLTMDSYLGNSFFDIIYREVSTVEHVRQYEKFLKKELVDDIENFVYLLQIKTLNQKRLWQDSSEGNPDMYEVCPSQIKLTTNGSPAGGSSWDRLELFFNSDENYVLKAAVFAHAFKSMGFDIDEMSSFDDYEDECEDEAGE